MKVGDYVRTKDGRISKIYDIQKNGLYILEDYNYSYNSDWLVKSSPNIIDLIEVGDYVKYNNKASFYKVCDLLNEKIIVYGKNFGDWVYINSDDVKIKSIVTKEQFEAMEYRIGE